MSPRRIVSIIIAVLNAVLFVGLFLPYSNDVNVLTALDPYSYIIIVYAIAGMITCILDKKVEINYLAGGLLVAICTQIVISIGREYPLDILFKSVQIGFYAYFIDGILLIIMTTIYSNMSSKRKIKSSSGVNGNAPTQTTNSLNMNMPVNNFKSLPVKGKEKKKAPMDMLMGGTAQPVTAQAHMGELGLSSINISKDNLNGANPAGVQQMNVQPLNVQPAKQVELNVGSMFQTVGTAQPAPGQAQVVQQPVQQAQAVQQQVVAQPQQVATQPQQAAGPRPDLLAGSEMSGQLDNSPYNPNTNNQGQGLFF